ncbi:hypothetical protein H8959_018116 [Pygathrix nigripes]
MARYTLLLLLAAWVLTGELWPGTEARAAPYGVKLCGREFIRAVIFTCGGSRWRRSDILAHEAMAVGDSIYHRWTGPSWSHPPASSTRCYHLWHKVLPRWVWEKVPDPANSSSGQPHMEQVPEVQPLGDLPILEVEEMEPPPVMESSQPPQVTAPLDSGYEKHFLPTPEELGLLGPPRPQVLA